MFAMDSVGAPAGRTGLVPKQAYREFLDEPLRGGFFGAAGCR